MNIEANRLSYSGQTLKSAFQRMTVLFGIALLASPASAVLNGFELDDGYRIFQRISSHPDYIANSRTQISQINLNAYNAGEYGASLGGPGGSFVANGPSIPTYSSNGLWEDLNTGSTYGLGVPGDSYIIGHDGDSHSGLGMLGLRSFDSSDPLDFAYSIDQRDFHNNGSPIAPTSIDNNAKVTWSVWACASDRPPNRQGLADDHAYNWTFYDAAGNAAGQVGWTDDERLRYRSNVSGQWTTLSNFAVDTAQYDRFDFEFDFASDTWSLSVFDDSEKKLVPIFDEPMGEGLSNLTHIEWHLDPGVYKTFFDDSRFSACFTDSVPLSTLLEGAPLCSGDKTFSDFTYSPIGDMPDAEDVIVHPITDDAGHFGVRFQGAFIDTAAAGASDALIEFKVEAPDGKLIKDVHLEANPLTVGDDGFLSITETFLPQNEQIVLSAYDIRPGSRQLLDGADLVDEKGALAPVQSLHVQKDIVALAQADGAVATLSFIDQTFSQCDESEERPGACAVAEPGSGVDGLSGLPGELGPVNGGSVDELDFGATLQMTGSNLLGDVDGNGVVSSQDFANLADDFGTEAASELAGVVDLSNSVALTSELASTQAVPEPSGLTLLAAACLIGISRRRRNS